MERDTTAICAPKIANFLQDNQVVSSLDFPSLARLIYAYHPCHYRSAGREIGKLKIEIYHSDEDGGAAYETAAESSFTFGDAVNDTNRNGAVVHEVTHMIQDMRKLKLSEVEMELDAYFAQALYHVRDGSLAVFKRTVPGFVGEPMAEIAGKFEDKRSYMLTRDFRDRRDGVRKSLVFNYKNILKKTDADVRYRLDGLAY